MPFTSAELSNIANASLDFYIRGKPLAQTIQDRPLLNMLAGTQKTFSGGNGLIRRNVKGEYVSGMQGFDTDDQLSFKNPGKIRQILFPWKEMHAGIQMTLTELKKAGISVVDSMTGENTSQHSDSEMTQISSLMEDKMDDLAEGVARSRNQIAWLDGTQDAKVPPGLTAFISDDPTAGVVAGIDRASTTWWRNRALVGGNKITASPSNQTLSKRLRAEYRQLRRYGGKPNKILAGSGFLEKLESEVSEKGIYTQSGFMNKGSTDIAMADISMRGVGNFEYDPTLDDLGRTNFAYILDSRRLYNMVMEGEDMKKHYPARPHDQMVIFQGVTWTGAMVVEQMNCHGVYEAA